MAATLWSLSFCVSGSPGAPLSLLCPLIFPGIMFSNPSPSSFRCPYSSHHLDLPNFEFLRKEKKNTKMMIRVYITPLGYVSDCGSAYIICINVFQNLHKNGMKR